MPVGLPAYLRAPAIAADVFLTFSKRECQLIFTVNGHLQQELRENAKSFDASGKSGAKDEGFGLHPEPAYSTYFILGESGCEILSPAKLFFESQVLQLFP